MISYRIVATRFNEEHQHFDNMIFAVAKTKEECETIINKWRGYGYMIDIVMKGEELDIEIDSKTSKLSIVDIDYIKRKYNLK